MLLNHLGEKPPGIHMRDHIDCSLLDVPARDYFDWVNGGMKTEGWGHALHLHPGLFKIGSTN